MTERILHVGDSLVGAGSGEDGAAEAVGGLRDAVERAVALDVDAVVHGGNLFAKPDPAASTVDAVGDAFAELASAGIRCFVVEGTRESRGDGNSLARLCDREGVRQLTGDPVTIGSVALYGVGHAADASTFLDGVRDLEPVDGFTCNVLCIGQDVWPPRSRAEADVSSYDLLDATDVHVDEVLASGAAAPSRWESDDFDYRVTYPGSTNPDRTSTGDPPRGTLLRADGDDRELEQTPLVTSSVDRELAQLRRALDFQPSDLDDADAETLADLYGLAARAKRVFERRRTEVREELLDRVDTDGRIDGRFASVTRSTRRRRNALSDQAVFEEVERAGVERDEVLSIDTSTLRDLVDEGDLDEEAVFEVDENPYVRVADVSLE